MQSWQKLLRGISMVGQLGFLIVTPPLVLLYLAHLLETCCGWGVWVSVAAIVVGLLAAAASVRSFLIKTLRLDDRQRKDDGPSSFNDHI